MKAAVINECLPMTLYPTASAATMDLPKDCCFSDLLCRTASLPAMASSYSLAAHKSRTVSLVKLVAPHLEPCWRLYSFFVC